ALACTRVTVEAETEHGEELSRVWRLDAGVAGGALADRVRWQIAGWLSGSATTRPTAGITRLRLVPEEVSGDHGRQLGFWGGGGVGRTGTSVDRRRRVGRGGGMGRAVACRRTLVGSAVAPPAGPLAGAHRSGRRPPDGGRSRQVVRGGNL